ncbi:MAG: bifunctional [glutamate--ammonia ligase]-adenylyl-L-tyrosine phosphorylase/[glutamate--ammonia-ligase] adenylyltransferase [Deltaproteobacteria bacterium]|nr:bifunctional [glutamate--ammonia ligase]-adenylyl-L-tyrosine phosphorylase/[glutamate--ammonia-ligase] adenylyltransferase [Deltaproteobacteria bacterium]
MSPYSYGDAWARLLDRAANPQWAGIGLARLREAGVDLSALAPEARARLVAALGSSPALASWLGRDPGLLGVLEDPEFERILGRDDYLPRLGGGVAGEPREIFYRRLRVARRRELLRIVAKEAQGAAPVEVTASEVSGLAEAALEAALAWALEELTARFGAPLTDDGGRNLPCVLGMGKLGGGELNLCSDVDLIFLFRTDRGRTAGGAEPPVDAGTFHAHLAALLADILGKVTDDGLVFRVDLDLRPEGRSGKLAQPVEAAVSYYQSWGQTWERAVLLKARPVAGDRDLGWQFLCDVEPFVFRRSLDYTTVEDFKEMKRRIDLSVSRRAGGHEDLKLGRGGIREVEFLVQTLQLIHGGKLPQVRGRATLTALVQLARAGVLETPVAEGLSRCYRFLRALEHAVQGLQFLQTHRLPRDPEERETLGRRLGFGAVKGAGHALVEALDAVREEVHAAYAALFHGASRDWEEEPGADEARALLGLEEGDPEAASRLGAAGFHDAPRALEGLRLLRRGPPRGPPSPRARRTLERIAPFLLDAASRSPDPDRALVHLGEFLAASGARASYLSLLEENPPTARLLVTLFGTSGFLSRYLVAHPELLDELVLGSAAQPVKEIAALTRELEQALEPCRDDEDRLDALRRFRNAEFLRIALNDLWGALGPEGVGRQITLVAEACLEAAYRLARERLVEKYGDPRESDGAPARFAVLGLGKLGGREIDYHSDLDVLFLYSGAGEADRPGGQALSNSEFFARLAQRIMGVLSTRTREGIAFRMDARLRPSGQAGPLVASLSGFAAYHGRGSQIWERQTLVKLRAVAGDASLGREAVAVVRRLLYAGPPAEDPRLEIARMRERIVREVGREAGGRVDVKAGPGGLVDVEFAVQALQLLHGWRGEALRSPNTLEALCALTAEGCLADEKAAALKEGYAFLRRVEAKLRILLDRPTDTLPAEALRLAELARGLGFGGDAGGRSLLEEVLRHRGRVRESFEAVFHRGDQ